MYKKYQQTDPATAKRKRRKSHLLIWAHSHSFFYLFHLSLFLSSSFTFMLHSPIASPPPCQILTIRSTNAKYKIKILFTTWHPHLGPYWPFYSCASSISLQPESSFLSHCLMTRQLLIHLECVVVLHPTDTLLSESMLFILPFFLPPPNCNIQQALSSFTQTLSIPVSTDACFFPSSAVIVSWMSPHSYFNTAFCS